MSQIVLYPLHFEPIYQYRRWGGRRLAELLTALLPGDGPIDEAWILSDRDDHASRVADGPLKGRTITQLMEQSREQLLGKLAQRFHRFPLLLKFLDAHEMLSVQVHPADSQTSLLPAGEALACIDFVDGAAGLVVPVVESATPVRRERLFRCKQFRLWRLHGQSPFTVGAAGVARVLVCIEGTGKSSTAVPLMPSEKAMCCSCLRRPERVFFGQAEQ